MIRITATTSPLPPAAAVLTTTVLAATVLTDAALTSGALAAPTPFIAKAAERAALLIHRLR